MVVHCKKDKFDTYIGRPSKWGNPFVIGKDGDREEVILKYQLYLNTRPDLLRDLPELNGKILGCWCENVACHGSILEFLTRSKNVSNWFSNMLPMDESLIYQNIRYVTVENFYQAMKLPKADVENRAKIALMSPYNAKRKIRNYKLNENWDSIKLDVMEFGLRHKFKNGTNWHRKLMLTNDWVITEWNNWNDKFWGKDIRTEEGENHLGKLLMKIRG